MQPLISPVDHESRSHACSGDDGDTPNEAQEYTPLLGRYPPRRRSTLTTIFVSFMLAILIFGIVVSLFLLLEQDREWPVNTPFEMISRTKWGAKPSRWPLKPLKNKPAPYVILTHTGSQECFDENICIQDIKEMQDSYQGLQNNKTDVPFNFMISGNGFTYEGIGWDVVGDSDIDPNQNAIILAAIGNFTRRDPSTLQLQEIKAFLDESIWRRKLSPKYYLIGRSFKGNPHRLFKAVHDWSHWIDSLSA